MTENRRDEIHVLGKVRLLKCSEESESSKNVLSVISPMSAVMYSTQHLSEMKNFQLDCVEVDLYEKILVYVTVV